VTTWTKSSSQSTAWTNPSGVLSRFGIRSSVLFNELGRTFNGEEQATTSGKRYFNGLTPTQVQNNKTNHTTIWA